MWVNAFENDEKSWPFGGTQIHLWWNETADGIPLDTVERGDDEHRPLCGCVPESDTTLWKIPGETEFDSVRDLITFRNMCMGCLIAWRDRTGAPDEWFEPVEDDLARAYREMRRGEIP